jgi:hypothetical protein
MASVTITTTAPQDARIVAAFTQALGRPATVADVKAFLIRELTNFVLEIEQQNAAAAAAAAVTPVNPT